MSAKHQLIKNLAEAKGQVVGHQFARVIQGLITKQEYEELAEIVEAQYEKEARELMSLSEEVVQAVTMYLDK